MGNTPLVRLNSVTRGVRPTVLAKVEMLNPGGSVKDRIGIRMIEAAEREGLLKPGRHDRRADQRQHRPRPRHRGRDPRLPLHLRDARQDEPGEDLAAARVRRRGHHHADGRRAASRPRATTGSPTGSPRRSPGRSSPTSTSIRRTPRPTTRRPAPRSGSRPTARSTCSSPASVPGARSAGSGATSRSRTPTCSIVGADTGGIGVLGRRAAPLPRRGHRRGLLARDVRSGDRRPLREGERP